MSRVRVVAAVLIAVVLMAGCDTWWSSGRYDATNSGFNRAEHSLGLAEVPGLQPAFTATIGAVQSSWTSPVVANGLVYVAAQRQIEVFRADGTAGCSGAPRTCEPLWTADLGADATWASPTVADGRLYVTTFGGPSVLQVFDAAGRSGCQGSPRVCAPLWTAAMSYWGNPTVANGHVYITSDGTLRAFDAKGEQGCSGTPKVCTALWRAGAPHVNFSASTSLTVTPTAVFAVDDNGVVGAYDAEASERCTGVPLTCPVRWTSAFPRIAPDGGSMGWTSPVVDGSHLLVYRAVADPSPPNATHQELASFDVDGVAGCRANANTTLGGPTICDPLWSTTLPGRAQDSQLTVAYGLVYAITRTETPGTDTIRAYRTDGAGCTGTPMTCPVAWRSTPSVNGKWAFPIVADHVLYVSTDAGLAAFDASGAGCADQPCPPATLLSTPPGGQNVAVADGRLYLLTTAQRSGHAPTTATLTMYAP